MTESPTAKDYVTDLRFMEKVTLARKLEATEALNAKLMTACKGLLQQIDEGSLLICQGEFKFNHAAERAVDEARNAVRQG
jgi:hypothetical protein